MSAAQQKNVRLSRRALELLRALKYVFNASDNFVIEAALNEMATTYLEACAQRLNLASRGLVPAQEVNRLRAEASVLTAALNVDAEGRYPVYRLEDDRIERLREDGTWEPLAASR